MALLPERTNVMGCRKCKIKNATTEDCDTCTQYQVVGSQINAEQELTEDDKINNPKRFSEANLYDVLKGLKKLKKNGPVNTSGGICKNLTFYTHQTNTFIIEEIVTKLSKGWKHRSDVIRLPIPGTSVSSPAMQYFAEKGLWRGEQRKLRYSLIDHLIEVISRDISNPTPPLTLTRSSYETIRRSQGTGQAQERKREAESRIEGGKM